MVKFDSIVMAAIEKPEDMKDVTEEQWKLFLTEQQLMLFRLAQDLDDLRGRTVVNAQEVSWRFAQYAEAVLHGQVFEPPTGWSNLKELDRDTATFAAKHEIFKQLFKPATGRKLREVIEDLKAAETCQDDQDDK